MIEDLISHLQSELKSNDFLVAGVGTALTSALLYSARSLPLRLWTWLKLISTSEITIASDENIEIFNSALDFFKDKKPFIRQSKFSSIPHESRYGEKKNETSVGIGYGNHYYLIKNRPCLVSYYTDNEAKLNSEVRKILKIKILSRHPKAIFDGVIESVMESLNSASDANIYSYKKYGGWEKIKGINPRSLDTVYISKDKLDSIKREISSFLVSKDSCIERGIPWKLSFLFEGEAGTGKSSLALALSSHYNLPIYIVSMSGMTCDEQLMESMNTVPQKSIMLIEDVDSQGVSVSREDNSPNNKNSSVSMSGILNSIDGITSPDGRILIMTTNHPEKLDPALIRAGRIDHRINVSKLSYYDAKKMFLNLTDNKIKLPKKEILENKTGAEIEVLVKTMESKVD
jgi:chaperone BCS1